MSDERRWTILQCAECERPASEGASPWKCPWCRSGLRQPVEVIPAYEADRLRAERAADVATLTRRLDVETHRAVEAEKAEAQIRAERVRYREALERIAQPMPSDYPGPDNWATARGIARAALEGGEDE